MAQPKDTLGANLPIAALQDDPHLDPQSPNEGFNELPEGGPLETSRPWRVANSLKVLLRQVDHAFPNRSRKSDGTIGDAAHASRNSDHNPHIVDGEFGVVTAVDITHDPASGCHAGHIADTLHGSRDPRIKYIIWKRRIANASGIGGAAPWAWRAYTGSNPHDKHCHISVQKSKEFYDNERLWSLPVPSAAETAPRVAEDIESLIRNGLVAVGQASDGPLLPALLEARDAITALLGRYGDWVRAPALNADGMEASPPDPVLLRDDYLELWDSCRIEPPRAGEVAWYRARLLRGRPRYEEVAAATGAPWWFIGIVHALEASFNFDGHLHNGDPLSARTKQVPRGRPSRWNPPTDWSSSAIDAIAYAGNAGIGEWDVANALFRFERYNGFGYRPRGIPSPYLWSFSNHYKMGKFVADGQFSPTAVSRQCGAAVMLKALIKGEDVQVGV